jgi:hypothetical protein
VENFIAVSLLIRLSVYHGVPLLESEKTFLSAASGGNREKYREREAASCESKKYLLS